MPNSAFAVMAVFAVYLLIAIVIVSLTRPDQSFGIVMGTIAIGVSFQAGVTFILLMFKGLQSRFLRTWAGLLGCNGIMLLVLLPFNLILLNSENDALILFADSATWICLGWWLGIAGFVYHRAVEISILQGAAIAFLIELLGVYSAYIVFQ